MATGWDAPFYAHIEQIARHLGRIAACMETAEQRELERLPSRQVPDYVPGSIEHWRNEVAAGMVVTSFTEWRAWYESDKAEQVHEPDIAVQP